MSQLQKNEPSAIDQFQAKVVERLRDDIRDLLPEEVLKELVTRAVEHEFFKPREIYQNSYSSQPQKAPS